MKKIRLLLFRLRIGIISLLIGKDKALFIIQDKDDNTAIECTTYTSSKRFDIALVLANCMRKDSMVKDLLFTATRLCK